MPEVICMRGLPGSGKSTYANSWLGFGSDYVRVNRDDLRQSLFDGHGILEFWQEEIITKAQREAASAALKAGRSVIVDDMNLRNKYLRAWNEFANSHQAQFRVMNVTTPVDLCVKRDSARERQVGEDVIRDLAKKFYRNGEFPTYEPIVQPDPVVNDPSKPWTIIVDIDGTMALNKSGRGWYDWSRVGEDSPNEPVVRNVVRYILHGQHVTFMSGRDSVCRDDTEKWLKDMLPSGYDIRWSLYMREEGDTRPDDVVKKELFDLHLRDRFYVDFVMDDRNSVVNMWRSLGLPCFQVAPGDF